MSEPTPADNPYETKEWRDFATHAQAHLLPLVEEASMTMSLAPATGESDIKFAVEIGLSIMMDKPILLVVLPGREPPPKLVALADVVVRGDIVDPQTQRELRAGMAKISEMLDARG